MSPLSRGLPKGSLFNTYYTEVRGKALLFSLDCSTLSLIRTLYRWVLSKEISSTIFKTFSMTWPGIEPRSRSAFANTQPTKPMNTQKHVDLDLGYHKTAIFHVWIFTFSLKIFKLSQILSIPTRKNLLFLHFNKLLIRFKEIKNSLICRSVLYSIISTFFWYIHIYIYIYINNNNSIQYYSFVST